MNFLRNRLLSFKKAQIHQNSYRNNGFVHRYLSSKLVRNVGIIAHIDAGKTTTSEQILYACGKIDTVGRVDSGDTVMDFLPQERERGITISSAAVSLKWKDYTLNWIDTPGHIDFTIEVQRSARVLDGAIVVLDAVAGVQAQTKTVWKQVQKQKIPALMFINKMDRDGASFERSIESIRSKLNIVPVPIQLPIGSEDSFCGVIDLISMCRLTWTGDHYLASSRTPRPPTIEKVQPGDVDYHLAFAGRRKMLELIAEMDEGFLEIYLNLDDSTMDTVSDVELVNLIRRLCLNCSIVPALCGASLRGKGIEPLLNSVTAFLPSPLDRHPEIAINSSNKSILKVSSDSKELCALAFKIIHDRERGNLVYVRVFSGSIVAKQTIRNSTQNIKERATQLLHISANDAVNIDEITTGGVGCIVGLKHTKTGDTLVDDKSKLHSFVLDGLTIPPPVFSLAIEPEKTSQLNDLHQALNILCLEDPSLCVEINKESGQTLLKGIGELHLEIICDRLRRDYGIEVNTGKSYVAFRETISEEVSEPFSKKVTYNKTFGNKRMFASIEFDIVSNGYTSECQFELPSEVKKSLTADEYTALLDGLQNGFIRGPSGYPVMGVKIIVKSVEKDADTTPGAVRACTVILLDNILKGEFSQFLEPVMSAEIDIPTQYLGNIVGDLSVKRRANIIEVVSQNNRNVIYAEIPLATMLGYATTIRSMTQGEGIFSLEYAKHAPVDKYLINE